MDLLSKLYDYFLKFVINYFILFQGATAMNKDSSRSHSIFTIYIETS